MNAGLILLTAADTGHVVFDAPAKVNLSLKVLGRRDDGYHELESLVAFASGAADQLTVCSSKVANVCVSGRFSNLVGRDNLIDTAMRELRLVEAGAFVAEISLQKAIPVGAGLGGGSADAGATLRALIALNPEIAERIDWQAIAVRLGADVPVCLENRASLMCGLGERVTQLLRFPTLHAVLVNALATPPVDKTAQVFSKLNAPALGTVASGSRASPGGVATDISDVDALIDQLNDLDNDLEAPALAVMPEIADVKKVIENTPGCRLARLTGAGPTCFGLYRSMEEAEHARVVIAKNRPGWWVVATPLN